MRRLNDAGFLPPECISFRIVADASDAMRIEYSCFVTHELLDALAGKEKTKE
jgi:hypothetical protein